VLLVLSDVELTTVLLRTACHWVEGLYAQARVASQETAV
jgi:hypothetical protein